MACSRPRRRRRGHGRGKQDQSQGHEQKGHVEVPSISWFLVRASPRLRGARGGDSLPLVSPSVPLRARQGTACVEGCRSVPARAGEMDTRILTAPSSFWDMM